MFKKSLSVVFTVVALVFIIGFATQWQSLSSLPSAYDPGLSLNKVFETADKPILVEFYTDTCSTCRQVTPTVHKVAEELKDKFILVMMNLSEPEGQSVAPLFGVTEIPALYVFDITTMRAKQAAKTAKTGLKSSGPVVTPIDLQSLRSADTFRQALLKTI